MDFIEQLFGVAPDGGSGTLELLLFLAPIAGVLAIRWFRHRARRRSALHRKADR